MTDTIDAGNKNPLVVFKDNFNRLIANKELALPSNVSEDAFRNAAIIAVQDQPALLLADQQSLFKSIRRAAASALVPDGREGALVLFKTKDKDTGRYVDKVQFMPMVFGLIKMARRSGTVSDIRAHIVYNAEVEQGRFTYVIGDNESLTHEPILFGDRGEPVAAYAIAKLTDGTIVREFMSAEDIDVVRRAGSSQRLYEKGQAPKVSDQPIGIWKDWASEMWKKTVIRRMTKRLDLSAEDIRQIQEDDDFAGIKDVTPRSSAPSMNPLLEKKLAAARGEVLPPEPEDVSQDPADHIEDAQEVGHETGNWHWTQDVDTTDAFPGADEFSDGAKAFKAGMKRTMCPEALTDQQRIDWLGGFDKAQEAAR
jgi:recombination protein RecT